MIIILFSINHIVILITYFIKYLFNKKSYIIITDKWHVDTISLNFSVYSIPIHLPFEFNFDIVHHLQVHSVELSLLYVILFS